MLPFVAIGLSAASLLFNIIGLAIPYWQYRSAGGVTANSGLWSGCFEVQGSSECSSITSASSELEAVRAMEILGMLFILGALVCIVLKQFVIKDNGMLPKIGGVCAEIAGGLMIVGTIIYAISDDTDASSLHAGFALCIIAGVTGIVAGVVMFMVKE